MILTVNNNELNLYKYIVTYTYQTSEISTYTDNVEAYRQMVNKDKEYSNFSFTELTLTDRQQSRYNYILGLGDKINLIRDINFLNEYVKNGYINPDGPDYLLELLKQEEHSLLHKEYITSIILSNLKEKRKKREISGIKFKDEYTAATDESSKTSITSLLISLQSNIITEVNYKFEEGYKLLNKEEILLLAKLVLTHTQLCFNAEKLAIEQLESLPIEELNNYLDKHKINDMFDDYYRQLYLELIS